MTPGPSPPDRGPAPVVAPDDLRWAERILAGDRAAFEELFARAGKTLGRYATSRLADADAVRDVVQSSLVKGLEGLHRYRGDGPLLAWLVGICRHEVLAHQRRRGKVRWVDLETVEQAPQTAGAVRPEDPAEALARRRQDEAVHLVLDAMPGDYGDVLEWKYIEGLSVEVIARRLGRSAKAAESLLTRARTAFRRMFDALPTEGSRDV